MRDLRGRWKVRVREFSFGGNHALGFRFRFERNPMCRFGNQIRKSIGPFDHRNAVAEKIIVESEPGRRLSIFQAKKIEMIDRKVSAGIFVNQGKAGTGGSRSRAQTGGETFDELRLAAAKTAGERKHIARFKIFREPMAESFRFVRAIGNERSHRLKFDV